MAKGNVLIDVTDLTGNASPEDVASGKTFYSNDETVKQTGTVRVYEQSWDLVKSYGMFENESDKYVYLHLGDQDTYMDTGPALVRRTEEIKLRNLADHGIYSPKDMQNQWNSAVAAADARVETNSESYKVGFNNGHTQGVSDADNRLNRNSVSYTKGVNEADARANNESANWQNGKLTGQQSVTVFSLAIGEAYNGIAIYQDFNGVDRKRYITSTGPLENPSCPWVSLDGVYDESQLYHITLTQSGTYSVFGGNVFYRGAGNDTYNSTRQHFDAGTVFTIHTGSVNDCALITIIKYS